MWILTTRKQTPVTYKGLRVQIQCKIIWTAHMIRSPMLPSFCRLELPQPSYCPIKTPQVFLWNTFFASFRKLGHILSLLEYCSYVKFVFVISYVAVFRYIYTGHYWKMALFSDVSKYLTIITIVLSYLFYCMIKILGSHHIGAQVMISAVDSKVLYRYSM